MKLTDQQIDAIIAGIKKQVDWNGWEYVRGSQRFKKELKAAIEAYKIDDDK
jgi:hypothetical protein